MVHGSYQGQRKKKTLWQDGIGTVYINSLKNEKLSRVFPSWKMNFNWITESSGRLCWRTPRNPLWLASFDEHELGGDDFEVLLRRRSKGLDSSVENNDKFNFIGLQTASNDSIDSLLEK